jgi:hypothetical protein
MSQHNIVEEVEEALERIEYAISFLCTLPPDFIPFVTLMGVIGVSYI